MPDSPPQVNAFILCDSAFQQAFTGKWCVIGTFGVIYAREFPVTHAPLIVFVGLSDFQGNAMVQVNLRDGSDGQIGGVQAQIPKLPLSIAEFALPFQPIKFEKAGAYTLELIVGGQLIAVRAFRVDKAPEPGQLPPGMKPLGGPPGFPPPPPEG